MRKMGLQYGVSTVQEFLWTTEGQLANLEELGEKHGLRYDPNSKTFTLDGDRWDEMIKVSYTMYALSHKTNLCFVLTFVLLCSLFHANP